MKHASSSPAKVSPRSPYLSAAQARAMGFPGTLSGRRAAVAAQVRRNQVENVRSPLSTYSPAVAGLTAQGNWAIEDGSPTSSQFSANGADDSMGETQAMLLGAVNKIYATRRAASRSQSATAAATPSLRTVGLETRRSAALKCLTTNPSPSPKSATIHREGSEVISETEDETQGPEMTLPVINPMRAHTSAEILEEMEASIAALKGSHAKDQANLHHLQDNLIRYKELLVNDKDKTLTACKEMGRAQESLEAARVILSKVVVDLESM